MSTRVITREGGYVSQQASTCSCRDLRDTLLEPAAMRIIDHRLIDGTECFQNSDCFSEKPAEIQRL